MAQTDLRVIVAFNISDITGKFVKPPSTRRKSGEEALIVSCVINSYKPNTLTQFWSQLSTDKNGLYVHPDDLLWFQQNQWNVQNQSVSTFDDLIRSDRFGKDDKQLHLSLIPVPFVGSLKNAEIFILLMNPGLWPVDCYAEEDPNFRDACISNLHQTNDRDEFPFYKLNPKFAWSGGFIWWEALLSPILVRIMEKHTSTYFEALEFLSKTSLRLNSSLITQWEEVH